MAGLVLTVFLDGLMALLLIVTTVYCWKLNKRIKILQDSKSELANIIQEFDISTQKATQSIADIHEATARIAENMQHKIDKANFLANDLQYMIDRGNKLAGNPESPAAASSRPASARSRSEMDKMRPSRGATTSRDELSQEQEAQRQAGSDKRSSIESMLNRVRRGSNDNDAALESAAESRPRRPGARLRSKAEQELFEALKAGGGGQ